MKKYIAAITVDCGVSGLHTQHFQADSPDELLVLIANWFKVWEGTHET